MKTEIEVNGKIVEVDLENMSEEEMEDYNINITNKKDNRYAKSRTIGKIKAVIPILSLMAFLLCGFLIEGGWRWSWSLLFITPVVESLLALKNKGLRRASAVVLSLLIIGGTIFIGCFFGVWRWCWVLFFLVPVVHIILD